MRPRGTCRRRRNQDGYASGQIKRLRVYEGERRQTPCHVFRIPLDGAPHAPCANAGQRYDKGGGVILTSTDFNGHVSRYLYDSDFRLTGIVKPGDSVNAPTQVFAYKPAGAEADLCLHRVRDLTLSVTTASTVASTVTVKSRETAGGGTFDIVQLPMARPTNWARSRKVRGRWRFRDVANDRPSPTPAALRRQPRICDGIQRSQPILHGRAPRRSRAPSPRHVRFRFETDLNITDFTAPPRTRPRFHLAHGIAPSAWCRCGGCRAV